jgi:hypothetical protein
MIAEPSPIAHLPVRRNMRQNRVAGRRYVDIDVRCVDHGKGGGRGFARYVTEDEAAGLVGFADVEPQRRRRRGDGNVVAPRRAIAEGPSKMIVHRSTISEVRGVGRHLSRGDPAVLRGRNRPILLKKSAAATRTSILSKNDSRLLGLAND